ncbi:U3 small nucleolar ribonucleoprotein protein MPP10 isoform X2 [Gallus gallus]|uniref:U3 small nucleolar ribonucleoprotein protein MPP10 isoform X2 n=1 Tax=Gallus gallus TaxID=9031 RepID=UPI000739F385|nr:U3 small nucleolar ribonucleoprotein protein MPP10 isoform X2 [Gallus gallus]XP_025009777.1 U3 small nucleolar ribonucleoprotein protein MPP10 isoform X2 [Gallus gallus]XP_040536663.1 U3 small nucleolar ribonucleoprotein protein MPP10 isoform X2 [Gallus gallus]XP_040536664.1 U3 small nucleolar ribonucleoprotein protein MPP10 isoform X2 [Gallus gallus]XP_046755265.1 U3 small nucleolar ribonucleoprotein protein MPP10 isoform X2 [Gallus gallus]XP_046781231.1 U3 small nucleolar ribonucleoprotei|eukprot:XP_015134484.1 U3 small nucleolar ribonucleoprotein protein MPP10 isoform X2 [Gallus gallus]
MINHGLYKGWKRHLLSVQDELAADFRTLTKTLYDLNKALGSSVVRGSPLKELVIENFDEEQIWQQLELQNNAVLDVFKKSVAQCTNDKDLCLISDQEDDSSDAEAISDSEVGDTIEAETEQDNAYTKHKTEAKEKKSKPRETVIEEYSDEDSDVDFDIEALEQETKTAKKTAVKNTGRKSVVDDKFFKLAEMEAFLEHMEKENGEREEEEEEDDIDYFEDIISEDEEEEFEEAKVKPVKSSRDLTYKDFFDPVDDNDDLVANDAEDYEDEEADSAIEKENEESMSEAEDINEVVTENMRNKKVSFSLPDDSETEDVMDMQLERGIDLNETKSSFEKRQEKMSEKIKSLEEELLEEKPWQLRGEVTGHKRPENSLLEETVLFDHAVRMAPVITEETTFQLEDIIKQRILDEAWDDVVPKERPKEDAFEYKKRITLDHEKSKLSLAEIYEQEYLKLHQQKTEEEENPEHKEIQEMMDSLFLKLDALCNFHFTPKPPVPEVKIVSNLPAISMEEVAPVAVSDAALLAPEEIKEKNKAGDVKTDAEKTATDKKRERRKKKLRKRIKLKEKEKRQKLLEKMKPEQGTKLSKKAAAAKLKKLTKEGKASLLKDEGKDKAVKSSQAFFSQLQDQVRMQIKDANKLKKKQKKQKDVSVHKLKL